LKLEFLRGPSTSAGPNSDRGTSRIEGDMICHQLQKAIADLNIAGLFSETPEAQTKGKTSISSATTMDLNLLPW